MKCYKYKMFKQPKKINLNNWINYIYLFILTAGLGGFHHHIIFNIFSFIYNLFYKKKKFNSW